MSASMDRAISAALASPDDDLALRLLAQTRAAASGPQREQRGLVPRPRGAADAGGDVVPLGLVVAELSLARYWHTSAAGTELCARFPEVVGPALASHIAAVGFDADTGTLRLIADSAAYCAQLRLDHGALISRLNENPALRDLPPVTGLDVSIGSPPASGRAGP